jgi:SAM-dependent methyltransferase
MSTFVDARAYDRLMGRWSAVLGHELVRFIGIAHGARILDVGCGTGSLTRAFLDTAPPREVVGIDPSPRFVELARDRIRDPRVRFETGDAMSLPLETGSFDAAAAMLVLNFVPDPARGLAEMRRVTRGGGLVAGCVWDYGGEMTMLRRFWDAAVALDPAAAPRHEARMPLCRAGELAGLFRAAGLEGTRESGIVIETAFTSFDDFWSPFLGGVGPSGAYVAALSPDKRSDLERRLRSDLWQDRADEARSLAARAWAAVGTVPHSTASR